jgi:SAM-dependent methyltransferase
MRSRQVRRRWRHRRGAPVPRWAATARTPLTSSALEGVDCRSWRNDTRPTTSTAAPGEPLGAGHGAEASRDRGIERAVERLGLAAVRVLDHDVIGQGHHPPGCGRECCRLGDGASPPNRQRNRCVVSLLEVQPTDRVLEIGFGPGLAIAELSRRVGEEGHVYGIDPSEVMLQQATRRNAAAIAAGRVTLTLGPSNSCRPPSTAPSRSSSPSTPSGSGRHRPSGSTTCAGDWRPADASPLPPNPAARSHQDHLACGRRRDHRPARVAGFTQTSTDILDLDPPVVCVLAVNYAPAHGRHAAS